MKGWDLIVAYINTGILNPKYQLSLKDKKFVPNNSAQSISTSALQAIVPIPTHKLRISPLRKRLFVQSFKAEYRKFAEIISDNIEVLSFDALLQSLEKACHQLYELLRDKTYSVGVIEGKSQAWVANLAYRFMPLEHLPHSVVQLGEKKYRGLMEHLRFDIDKVATFNGTLVMFDDVSYTGTQVIDFLHMIQHKVKALNKKNQDNIPNNHAELYIVIPFASKLAKTRISEEIQKNNTEFSRSTLSHRFSVQIVFQTELRNIADIQGDFSDREQETFYQLLEYPNHPISTKCYSVSDDVFEIEQIQQKTLCFTQWKKADPISLPKIFSNTHIVADYLQDGLTKLPTLVGTISSPYARKYE